MREMTSRERFNALFNGEPVDRAPFFDYMGGCNYRACLERWKTEGLPQDATFADVNSIIGFDTRRGFRIPVHGFIWPEHEIEQIETDGCVKKLRNRWGGISLALESGFMPVTVSGPVKNRSTWNEVRQRLSAGTPGRYSEDLNEICQDAADSDQPVYTGDLPIGFFGALRELMGFEELAMMYYDAPALIEDILDTLCDLWIEIYGRVQDQIALDYFFVWEDMCDKNGPLISPAFFRKFMLPRYKRFTESLRERGCKHVAVDSDGDERALVPLWIEGGVNIVLPWETQFGLDLHEVRKRFPNLGMIGGINKHALEFGREAIDQELKKVPYMLERGRYIPSLDHGVTDEVSWDNYRYFYETLRELIWKYTPGF